MPKALDPSIKKTELKMDRRFIGQSVRRRMAEAIRLVEETGWTQQEAAEFCGVSRTRVNVHVQKRKEETPDKEVVPDLGVTGEKRRLPEFWEFDRLYFSGLICPDCQKHHETPKLHFEMSEMIRNKESKRDLILTPPYHSKSTLATVKDTIYDVVEDPNSRTIVVSKSTDLAEKFLESIKEWLTNPDLYENSPRNLIDDWGPFQDASMTWAANQIKVGRRSTSEKDPTVMAIGVGKQVYGRRADKIKFDDIADTENQASPERVIKMLLWLDKMALTRIGKRGKAIWVGTRVDAGDIYKVLKARQGYNVLLRACIQDEEAGEMLWGDHFPLSQALIHRSEMTAADFQLIYQQLDVPGAGASFLQTDIDNAKDRDRHTGSVGPGWKIVGGLDPAGGTGRSGYTAMMVKGVDMRTGKRFYIDIVNVRAMKAPQLRDEMMRLTKEHGITEWRVESNGLQSQIVQFNEEIIHWMTSRGVRVVPHFTGGNKWDPEFGVESTAPLWTNQMVSVPWCCSACRTKWGPFLDQLMQFPMSAVTDMVMADWFSELACRDLARRQAIPLFNSRMKVPPRIMRGRHIVDFAAQEIRSVPMSEQREGHLTSFGMNNYRRMTLGQPRQHAEVDESEPPPAPKFVNVAGTVGED